MAPTLQVGERLLVLRRWSWMPLRKKQIVLVWPTRTGTRPRISQIKPYVKRIIGLSQETLTDAEVEFVDLFEQKKQPLPAEAKRVWYIPPDHIFVRGDNRKNSLDSVYWGPIPERCVLGIALAKLPRRAFVPPSPPPFSSLAHPGLAVNQIAPPFGALTMQGKQIIYNTCRGYPVLLVFFAPADHCREAIETCKDLVQRRTQIGAKVIFVSCAARQPTRHFIKQMGLTHSVLIAPRTHSALIADYNITTTPAYCLIDAQGKVQASGWLHPHSDSWRKVMEDWERLAVVDVDASSGYPARTREADI